MSVAAKACGSLANGLAGLVASEVRVLHQRLLGRLMTAYARLLVAQPWHWGDTWSWWRATESDWTNQRLVLCLLGIALLQLRAMTARLLHRVAAGVLRRVIGSICSMHTRWYRILLILLVALRWLWASIVAAGGQLLFNGCHGRGILLVILLVSWCWGVGISSSSHRRSVSQRSC